MDFLTVVLLTLATVVGGVRAARREGVEEKVKAIEQLRMIKNLPVQFMLPPLAG
jgi:hypothetical protein